METQTQPFNDDLFVPVPLAAFRHISAEILALTDDEVVTVGADIQTSFHTALAVVDRIEPMLPAMAAQNFDMKRIGGLSTYAWACHYAHLVWLRPKTPPQMIAGATALRKQLLASAEALVAHGFADAERVAALHHGRGRRDLANSLLQLADLYCELWPEIAGKTAVTEELVVRASRLGSDIIRRLAGARTEFEPVDPNLTRKAARDRTWTLMLRAYEECRRAVGWIRWHEGDADQLVPSLYTRPRPSKPAPAAVEVPTLVLATASAQGG